MLPVSSASLASGSAAGGSEEGEEEEEGQGAAAAVSSASEEGTSQPSPSQQTEWRRQLSAHPSTSGEITIPGGWQQEPAHSRCASPADAA